MWLVPYNLTTFCCADEYLNHLNFLYSLVMYLKLTPIELKLFALVTLEVNLGLTKFKKTLFKAELWSYKAPTITKKLIDNRKDEEDKTPPDISPFTDDDIPGRKRRVIKEIMY